MISRQKALWILLLIVVIGVGLRTYQLTARSLWFDEAFSWRLIQFPLQEMIARDAADVHPPLYYIALRGWATIFGTSLFALRFFSVVMAGASIAAAYLFTATAWRSRGTALLAAALIALSGWQISFAWEARMYTFGIFLSLISSWLLVLAMRQKKQQPLLWIAYAIVTAAFAYTHYFAFFTIAAQVLTILIALIRQTKWRVMEILQSRFTWYAVLAGVTMLIIYAPWIPTFLAQNQQVQVNYWVPPIGGWSIPDTFFRMVAPTRLIPSHSGIGILTASLPIVVTMIVWIWTVLYGCTSTIKRNNNCDSAWLTSLSGSVPFILAILLSFTGQSLYHDRFLVFTNAFILIAFSVCIFSLPKKWLRYSVAFLVLAGFIVGSVKFWQELDIANKQGSRAATQYIIDRHKNGEPIIVDSPFVYFAIEYYTTQDPSIDINPSLFSETGELSHFAGGPILTEADIISPAELAAETSGTIWAIDTTGFGGSETKIDGGRIETEAASFQEVFAEQGYVIVRKYQR